MPVILRTSNPRVVVVDRSTVLNIVQNRPVVQVNAAANTVVGSIARGPQGAPGPQGPAGGTAFTRIASTDLGGHRVVRSVDATHAGYASSDDLAHGDDTLGITTGAASAGADASIQSLGSVSFNGWAWTPGEPVFLSTSGLLTQTPPDSGFVQVIGHAEDAITLALHIEPPIYLE